MHLPSPTVVSVCPLSPPISAIFYLDFKYDGAIDMCFVKKWNYPNREVPLAISRLSDYNEAKYMADLSLIPWPIVVIADGLAYAEFEDGRWAMAEVGEDNRPKKFHTSQGYHEVYNRVDENTMGTERHGDGLSSNDLVNTLYSDCGLKFCEWAFGLVENLSANSK